MMSGMRGPRMFVISEIEKNVTQRMTRRRPRRSTRQDSPSATLASVLGCALRRRTMKRAWLVVFVGLWVGLVSCGKLGGKAKQESLLDLIPKDALAAVVIRADALKLVRQQLDDDPEMQKELHEYLVKR